MLEATDRVYLVVVEASEVNDGHWEALPIDSHLQLLEQILRPFRFLFTGLIPRAGSGLCW